VDVYLRLVNVESVMDAAAFCGDVMFMALRFVSLIDCCGFSESVTPPFISVSVIVGRYSRIVTARCGHTGACLSQIIFWLRG
jgi:hypothetical protein